MAINQYFHDLLLFFINLLNRLSILINFTRLSIIKEDNLVFLKSLSPLLKITHNRFECIIKSLFKNRVDKKSNKLNAHITHHQLSNPLIKNLL